jgi:hypothetical protein
MYLKLLQYLVIMVTQYVGSLPLGEGWGGASQPEIRYKEVFELALHNPEMRDSIFIPTEIDKLKEIAQLCPFVEGNAVYMARVILHSVEPEKDYYNYCEFAKDPKRTSNARIASQTENNEPIVFDEQQTNIAFANYQIVPNPNNGNFALNCISNETLLCEITDFTGRIILSKSFKPINGSISFNNLSISKGIYSLRVLSISGDHVILRVVIK